MQPFIKQAIAIPDVIPLCLPAVRAKRQAAGQLKGQDQEEAGGQQGGWTPTD